MDLTWICVILGSFVFASGFHEDEFKEFISLTKYGYEDSCLEVAEAEWIFINNPTNKTCQSWEAAASNYALHKIKQVNETIDEKIETFHDPASEYTYNIVIKPGDALLENNDYGQMVSFAGRAELLRLTGYYVTGSKKHFRQDVELQLTLNGNPPKEKLSAWTAWHKTMSPLATNFSHSLQLVEKAAKANGKTGIREYWEMLSGYENGYEHAKKEWTKIASGYKKILDFVKNRLNQKYGENIEKNTLPAHLLGSLQGHEWTSLAMDVIPYNDVTYSIRRNLLQKQIVGETLYKEASKLGHVLLKHVPHADFWKESNFSSQCPSHLINLCKDGKMRISTCSEASIANFISAHKNVAKILTTQMSHDIEPILNMANRYSALEEGVAEVFGILSVSHAWLNSRGLIDNNTDLDQARTVSMMITALDVLPRMAYYLAADTWRIDATVNNAFSENNLTSTWWKYRMQYQGINTSVPDLPTFLDDSYITSNKPYLAKFLGSILGFQIYEYLMESTEVRYETILSTTETHHLAKIILENFADNWTEVIREHLNIYEVNSDTLLSYFSTLLDYIEEEAELNESFSIPEEKENDLDMMAYKYRKMLNSPSTTTTTTTTTTRTTPKPIMRKPNEKLSTSNNRTTQSDKSQSSPETTKNSTSSKEIEIPTANKAKDVPIQTETVPSEETGSSEGKSKPNTSKAVWAVASVLIAVVIICIIAIFGRRRCRKAPKNRRYV